MAVLLTEITVSVRRFSKGTTVSGCVGSHVSEGTVEVVLMANASAQSLAKRIVYLISCDTAHDTSICTLRTTRLAVRFADVASTASTSPGQISPCVSKFHPT